MGVYADIQFKIIISTNAARQTPNVDLHGAANGLVLENFQNTRQFAPREGAYSGQRIQDDLKITEGNFPFTVLENGTTKQFYGKQGQFCDMELKTFADDGTTLISTHTIRIKIQNATPVMGPRQQTRIRVDGPIEYYNVA